MATRDDPAGAPANAAVPHNLDAEQSVLGALLLNPKALQDVESILRPRYFQGENHQTIYAAMLALQEKRLDVDPISLVNQLQESKQLQNAGGAHYLDYLADHCPTSVNVGTYARIVERKALLRDLLSASMRIGQMARAEEEDIEVILDKAEQEIYKVGQARVQNDLMPIEHIMPEVMNVLEEGRQGLATRGLPTGFTQLDALLGGFGKNDLLILAARPGMGKSSFALTIAQHAAMRLNSKVGIFSLEMGRDQLCQRLLAMETNLNLHTLRIGDVDENQWQLVLEASDRVGEASIFIDDTPGASVSELRGKARRLDAQVKLDLLVIDYLQLMSGSEQGSRSARENRQQEITFISSSIKNLARELNVPVLALSQLSRAVESRQDKRPMLQDLRESGSIEQDADVVMFLYRDDYYNEDSLDQNLAELIVAKHRNGALGRLKFFFHKEATLFRELALAPEAALDEPGP